jgi:hypothetical protein
MLLGRRGIIAQNLFISKEVYKIKGSKKKWEYT